MNRELVRTPPKKMPGQGCGPRRIAGVALDVRTAAALIGVTEKTLRAQVGRRLVPHRRLGARIVFLRTEVEQWLAGLPGCTVTEAQANQEARR